MRENKSLFTPVEMEFIATCRAKGMDASEISEKLTTKFSIVRKPADVRLAIGAQEAEAEVSPSEKEIVEFITSMADGSTPYQELRELAELRYSGKYTKNQIEAGLEAAMRLEQIFSKEELAYFERRSHEGATNKVIATELTSRYGNKYTASFIAGERERRNFPPANAETVVKFTVKERRPGFSKAAMPAPSPRQQEYAAAAEIPAVPAGNIPKPRIEPLSIKINFDSVPVKTFTVGKTYIYAGAGAVAFIGVEDSNVGGIESKLFIFDQIHNESDAALRKSSEAQARKKVRELATPHIMEQVLQKIELGLSDISRQSMNNIRLKAFYQDKLESSDIAVVTDLLCLLRGNSRVSAEVGATEFEYGERAKKIIASEFAVVMNVEYKEALRHLDDALSKTAPLAVPAALSAERPKTLGPVKSPLAPHGFFP